MPSRPRTALPALALRAALALAGCLVVAIAAPAATALADPPRPSPVPPPAGAMGEREVTITNRSELAISEVYVSPTSTDAWGEDRLGEVLLEPRKSTRLRLGRMRDCGFDVLVIYEDASREERTMQNLCRTRQVTFDGRGRILPQLPTVAARDVTLANQSGRAIQQVFISAADAPAWGDDLLGRAISVGEHGMVTWRGGCTVDIRVVFENRAAEERRGIDLCQRAALSIEPGWTTSDEVPVPPS